MNRFNILKIEKMKDSGEIWISVLLKDNVKKHEFWIDCSLMDGYGNKENYKTEDLYVDWDFNQYIFMLDNENDLTAQAYQNDAENIENITYFIDTKNDYLVNILRGAQNINTRRKGGRII